VRLRAIGTGGASAPSNEVVINVGAPCNSPPAPSGLTFSVSGRTVTLSWIPTGVTAFSLEVGTGPGLANLAVFELPPGPPTITATAAPGTYYVRVRARNLCGASLPSNEVVIAVP
jgi:hypothetical protein